MRANASLLSLIKLKELFHAAAPTIKRELFVLRMQERPTPYPVTFLTASCLPSTSCFWVNAFGFLCQKFARNTVECCIIPCSLPGGNSNTPAHRVCTANQLRLLLRLLLLRSLLIVVFILKLVLFAPAISQLNSCHRMLAKSICQTN